jgi:hypothetical protein
MLRLDLGVGAGKAEPGCALEGAEAGGVELSDQSLEVGDGHGGVS